MTEANGSERLVRLAGQTIVAKLGGSALGSHDTTLDDVATLVAAGSRVVLVHGGGAAISAWLQRTGQEPRFVGGLRVTDATALEMVVMVLAGKVNKELVAALLSKGARAVGLSGLDGAMLKARQRSAELGFVGDIAGVDVTLVDRLLDAGYLPVVAPIGIGDDGQIFNINADTSAAELAVALKADRLIFLSDVPGICHTDGKLLPLLSVAEVQRLIASGVITGGMIPKAEACFRALEAVASAQIVDGRRSHALLQELVGSAALGTTIVR